MSYTDTLLLTELVAELVLFSLFAAGLTYLAWKLLSDLIMDLYCWRHGITREDLRSYQHPDYDENDWEEIFPPDDPTKDKP